MSNLDWTRKEIEQELAEMGWTLASYSPGDGVTRYRFFCTPNQDYFGGSSAVYTALGLKEARVFFAGVRAGCFHEIGKKAA